jgi:hypothetical protein
MNTTFQRIALYVYVKWKQRWADRLVTEQDEITWNKTAHVNKEGDLTKGNMFVQKVDVCGMR